MKRGYSLLFFLFFAIIFSQGQSFRYAGGIRFEHYQIRDGLPANSVSSIIQDKKGFVWMGTHNGLVRFDGIKLFTYKADPSDSGSIIGNDIKALFEDNNGFIWVGTNKGLNRLNPGKGTFDYFFIEGDDRIDWHSNLIQAIGQDSLGAILIGTSEGLIRITNNGQDYQIYTISKGNVTVGNNPSSDANGEWEKFSSGVHAIYTDHSGISWFGGGGGFFSLEIVNNPSSPIEIKSFSSGVSYISAIGGSKTKGLWILGSNFDNKYQQHSCVLEYFDLETHDFKLYETPMGVTFKFSAVYEDREGQLWLGTKGTTGNGGEGIYLFSKELVQTGEWINWPEEKIKNFKFDTAESFWPTQNQINCIYGDIFNTVWIGTKMKGIYKFSPGASRFPYFSLKINSENQKEILPYRFFQETADLIWIGTEQHGLYRFNRSTNEVDHFFPRLNENQPAYSPFITDIIKDNEGNIWISTEDGTLHLYDEKYQRFQSFSLNESDSFGTEFDKLFIYDTDLGSNQTIWLATNLGVIPFYLNEKRFGPILGTDQPEMRSCQGHTNCVLEDNLGNLWIGSSGMGLTLLPKKLPHQVNPYDTLIHILPEKTITEMYLDNNGTLWAGTYAHGAYQIDPSTKSTFHISQQQGLIHDYVESIVRDKEGFYWMVTPKGISRYDAKKDRITNYGEQDGLYFSQRIPSKAMVAENGELYMGTMNGFHVTDPREILQNIPASKMALTGLKISNKEVEVNADSPLPLEIDYLDQLILKHHQNDFTLEYLGLNFDHSLRNRYRFKLEGYNEEWIDAGTDRTATYTNISPGKYTFKVMAANEGGQWDAPIRQLDILIQKPWWSTNLAYFIYALLLSVLFYGVYRFQLNRKIAAAETEKLRELDAAKSKLYTNITHEFRTPLTIILGMVEQLKYNPKDWLEEGLQMIQRNGERLLTLVNQMLDLAKIESGNLPLHLIQSDILLYLKYLLSSNHSYAATKDIRLHFLSPLNSFFMDYDQEKLQIIISNLISNSIKFTPPDGDIYLMVETKSVNSSHEQLEIRVKDTGRGIPQDQLPFIFDRFFQGETYPGNNGEGSGIGLTLTKELIEIMGGTINVKSEKGKGTIFTILLPVTRNMPLAESPELVELNTDHAVSITHVNKDHFFSNDLKDSDDAARLLIVEDNRDVMRFLQLHLKDTYQLYFAENGEKGWQLAKSIIPDLIISDIMMPVSDGYELCGRLKSDPHTSHIPIILLTAKGDMGSRLEGFEKGADAYLSKPFNKKELLVRIRKLMELRTRLHDHYLSVAGIKENNEPSILSKNQEMEDAFVLKIRDLILENLENYQLSVEWLCGEIGISHAQLHRKLKALTGCSANQFIRKIKLKKAKELLSDPVLTIGDISFQSGFADPDYFSRVFKKEEGCTPTHFRNRLLGKPTT